MPAPRHFVARMIIPAFTAVAGLAFGLAATHAEDAAPGAAPPPVLQDGVSPAVPPATDSVVPPAAEKPPATNRPVKPRPSPMRPFPVLPGING
jgi:hypothetical protein